VLAADCQEPLEGRKATYTFKVVGLMMIGFGDGKDSLKMRNVYKILASKPKLGSLIRLGDNIKIFIRDLG